MKTIIIVFFSVLWLMVDWNITFAEGSFNISEEIVIASDGPGGFLRSSPSVAFGGGQFLVAWQEGWHGDGGDSRIYVSRIGMDGRPIDKTGIEVAPSETGVQENPIIAFHGDTFLIVWQDLRNGSDCDVYGIRLSSQGKMLDREALPIAVANRSQVLPDAATDDSGFVVVWHGFQKQKTDAEIFVRRIGENGIMGKFSILANGSRPKISWNGKRFLLVYSTVRQPNSNLVGETKCWTILNENMKVVSKGDCKWSNPEYALGVVPKDGGWLISMPGGPPGYWGRTIGIQKTVRITPDGSWESPSNDNHYNPVGPVPDNWLDTSWKRPKRDKKNGFREKAVWPWGKSSLAKMGPYSICAWQQYGVGGATGFSLVDSDIRIGRIRGWKSVDHLGGFALADSLENEVSPCLAAGADGVLLCVYEKRMTDGRRQICAKRVEMNQI